MTRDEALDYLIDFLDREGIPLSRDISQIAAVDYFAEGIVDSVSLINLILDVESQFGFRFDLVQLTEGAGRTLGGLADIIVARSAAKGV